MLTTGLSPDGMRVINFGEGLELACTVESPSCKPAKLREDKRGCSSLSDCDGVAIEIKGTADMKGFVSRTAVLSILTGKEEGREEGGVERHKNWRVSQCIVIIVLRRVHMHLSSGTFSSALLVMLLASVSLPVVSEVN
jgi:hypothetical protein